MAAERIPERNEIPVEFTWDLTDIFKSDEDWLREYEALMQVPEQLAEYEGTLGESAARLLEYMQLDDEVSVRLEKLMGYAGCKADQDTADSRYQDMRSKGVGCCVAISGAASFATPELIAIPEREFTLQKALEPLKDQYDYILIDCPPSLELLTLNALCAADSILVPVQCEYYALEGLSDLMTTLRAVKRGLNPSLSIFGVLLTMYDGRTNFSAQVAEEVRRHFPGKVFAAVIPRNVRLSEAPSHGLPVRAYDKFSRGCAAYEQLADEILEKEGA